jgi:hypothetical protein
LPTEIEYDRFNQTVNDARKSDISARSIKRKTPRGWRGVRYAKGDA